MVQTQIAMGIVGIPVSGFLMLPTAILADSGDWDERRTGQRKEAVYYGMQSVFQKVSIGFSVVAAAWLMYLGGDLTPTERGLKAIAVVAGVGAAAAFLVFLAYPIAERDGKIVSGGE